MNAAWAVTPFIKLGTFARTLVIKRAGGARHFCSIFCWVSHFLPSFLPHLPPLRHPVPYVNLNQQSRSCFPDHFSAGEMQRTSAQTVSAPLAELVASRNLVLCLACAVCIRLHIRSPIRFEAAGRNVPLRSVSCGLTGQYKQ